MSEIIASVSGVRGIYGETLTPENIIKYTSAYAEFILSKGKPDHKKIVIGNDGRLHGAIISDIAINTLRLCGLDVVNINTAPTPTVQIATEALKCSGGISVTASHNPQEWNGLKFLNGDGTFLDEYQVNKFLKIAERGNFRYASKDKIGKLFSDYSWLDKHIEKVLKLQILDLPLIGKRKFKVVVDAVNSSGSVIVPELLKKLGCSVIELFCDSSGIFPHMPEPIPKNLVLLSNAVKKHKADLGISVDPDADRLVLITDKGEPFGEENTITAVTNFVLKNTKSRNKNVTVNLSTSRSVDVISKNHNAAVYRSPVGEINVVKEMFRRKSVIGGEGSGGVIYPELHYGRDSLAGIALVLNEFAGYKGKASDYKNRLPQFHIYKSKIESINNPVKILENIRKNFMNDKNVLGINTHDGLKIDFKDYWVHLRKSNTEPIIRIITEAQSMKDAKEITEYFTEMM